MEIIIINKDNINLFFTDENDWKKLIIGSVENKVWWKSLTQSFVG